MVKQTCRDCGHEIEWNQKKDGSGSYPINPRVNGKYTFHSIFSGGKRVCSLDGETVHDKDLCEECASRDDGQTKIDTPKPVKQMSISTDKILLDILETQKEILAVLQEISAKSGP